MYIYIYIYVYVHIHMGVHRPAPAEDIVVKPIEGAQRDGIRGFASGIAQDGHTNNNSNNSNNEN